MQYVEKNPRIFRTNLRWGIADWGSGVGRIELEHAKIAQHAHTNKREQINAGLVDLTKSLAHILIASGLVEGPRMAKRKPKIIRKPVAPPVNEW